MKGAPQKPMRGVHAARPRDSASPARARSSSASRSPGAPGSPELGDGDAHAGLDGERARASGGVGAVAVVGQPGDVVGSAHRVVDDGAHPRLDPHRQAGQAQRHHDVGEEDGGVHPMAAHGLERDLGRELGGEAGVEHVEPGALAQGPVLRQAPPRLAHEPHGRARGTPAPERFEQGGHRVGGEPIPARIW